MLLFEGPADFFISEATGERLAPVLARRFSYQMGRAPSPSEVTSWHHSLHAFANCLAETEAPSAHVLVEYKLPLSSSRLDCMVVGEAPKNSTHHAVIVELKQWEVADESPFDECVYIFGEHKLHPSAQVGGYTEYLRDCLQVFGDDGIVLEGCAYLHNLRDVRMSVLGLERYRPLLESYPIFDERTIGDLTTLLKDRCGRGRGGPLAGRILNSRYRPSPKLLEHTARIIEGDPVYRLLDAQQIAYNAVSTAVAKGLAGSEKAVFVIEGGPGTGKSVIAMRLFADMARKGYIVNHATGSKAFTTNVRARVGKRSSALFRYFNSFTAAKPNMIDLLLCDEAHRIRESSNGRYTRRSERSDRSQLEELVAASRVSVFLLDKNQVVRPGEIGSPDLIRSIARELGEEPITIALDSQFRCAGSAAYIEWVEHLLGLGGHENRGWLEAKEFDFRVVDAPQDLERLLRQRLEDGQAARMLAGYCWFWSDPVGGRLLEDVMIGEWRKPWNPKKGGSTPATDPYTVWASTPGGFEQIGCIYSAQGFEWDYVGVIIGPDLRWRGDRWEGDATVSFDTPIQRMRNRPKSEVTALLANTYRVLLTRGMRGCYVYCTDKETREHLRMAIAGGATTE